MPSRLFGFSNFLKRFSLNLAFDSFQELVETSFGTALPEQYRIFNWDAISAYLYTPILNLICSKDEKYTHPLHSHTHPELTHTQQQLIVIRGWHMHIANWSVFRGWTR